VIQGDYTVSGSEALSYINDLVAFAPELNDEFSKLATEASCAMNYGVIDAKAYLTNDLTEAGAMVVLSNHQAQQLPVIALKCLVSQIIGGGPGVPSRFQPCFTSYTIEDSVAGVEDRYYVYAAGTNAAWCTYLKAFDGNFDPQPITY
jgi:hypothetical protein